MPNFRSTQCQPCSRKQDYSIAATRTGTYKSFTTIGLASGSGGQKQFRYRVKFIVQPSRREASLRQVGAFKYNTKRGPY
jgi:hypothetical protein